MTSFHLPPKIWGQEESNQQGYWIFAVMVVVAIALVYLVRSQPNMGTTSLNGSTLSNPGPSAKGPVSGSNDVQSQ